MPLVNRINLGIVGAEAAKFTPEGERKARAVIRELLADPLTVLVSGGCHLGGIDIWAEEEYAALPDRADRPEPLIYVPKVLEWSKGYRPRNLQIAKASSYVHNIVVSRYPETFTGPRFSVCYHCAKRTREYGEDPISPHVKSGGCWTAHQAELMGKFSRWHIIVQ